ncbi:MAG: hypothetical protein K6B38_12195 [Ruminococcus sp.]|nr:hypothetical protein [Ruminococcus sp.]
MAKYGVDKAGADKLRDLAIDLRKFSDSITESGNTLKNTISGLSDGLGVFADQILEMATGVNLSQNKCKESVDTLITKLNNKANEIETLINF